MKHAIRIALTTFLLLFLVLLTACGIFGGNEQIQGSITGINAKVPMRNDIGPNFEEIVFGDSIIVQLSDDEGVVAACPKELMSKVKLPDSDFQYTIGKMILNPNGVIVVDVVVNLEFDQSVMVEKQESDEWLVTKVLE